ncbi:MAG: hypothetical protein J4G04_01210 [Nitrosopumilaceae archaeon]|nr:hypothetical protein [Nitrosopumilaceae archaeon]
MAMPMDYSDDSQRTDSVHDYKRTCIDFIHDISGDYKAWVDYYKLPPEEDARRRLGIDAAVERSCAWLAKVPQTIKAVDVVMNDGIQKMAEATAGRPFPIGVFVNDTAGYASAKPGAIPVRVRATPREGRRASLGYHFQQDRFRVESTCPASISGDISDTDYGQMDLRLELRAPGAAPGDVISFTITVCETQDGAETDRRGLTTIIHIV